MSAEIDLKFMDTNILVYLLVKDLEKNEKAESLLRKPTIINVQVLNELTTVARRKTDRTWREIEGFIEALGTLKTVKIRPLTRAVHDEGRRLAERYNFAFYDAVIVAAALDAGCNELVTEDMQSGLVVDGQLTLINPFAE